MASIKVFYGSWGEGKINFFLGRDPYFWACNEFAGDQDSVKALALNGPVVSKMVKGETFPGFHFFTPRKNNFCLLIYFHFWKGL